MDEALGLPTEHAALLALRTQQVIAYETGVADTVDPLAGSYYVESLTDAIEAGATEYIAKIDTMGGATRAIERGFQQREIHEAAYRWQKQVETGDAVVVGVNRFTASEAVKPPLLKVDASAESARRERLAALRRRRDAKAVDAALLRVDEAARTGANLMPPILTAVESQATLGEIADRLRAVFGIHHETFAF
jgi:methylmalonyl-CoA mutase N-terminal domain/subunit